MRMRMARHDVRYGVMATSEDDTALATPAELAGTGCDCGWCGGASSNSSSNRRLFLRLRPNDDDPSDTSESIEAPSAPPDAPAARAEGTPADPAAAAAAAAAAAEIGSASR